MLKDAQGLLVSSEKSETVDAIDRLLERQANQRLDQSEQTTLLAAADRDPSAMPNIVAAVLNIHTGDTAKAHHYLARAGLSSTMTSRESLFLDAAAAWAEGDIDTAISHFEQIVNKWPRDMYAVRLCCTLKFYARKDAEGALTLVRSVIDQIDDRGQALALLSFMEEEAGLFNEAETSARAAVAIDRDLILGQHTVAHVMEAQGRDAEGVAWLEQFTDTWEDLNESFNPHMWMHLGLHYLGTGHGDRVVALFDDKIATRYLNKGPAQLYGTNLLARAELGGFDVGRRFAKIVSHFDLAVHQHIDPLSDLHHVYALSRTDVGAHSFLESMVRHAASVHPVMEPTWREVALPTAQGIIQFNTGDTVAAVTSLESAHARFVEIGGSAIERSMFTDLWLHALIESGRKQEASAELNALRLKKGGDHPFVQHFASLLTG